MKVTIADNVPPEVAVRIKKKVIAYYTEFWEVTRLSIDGFGEGYIVGFKQIAKSKGKPKADRYRIAYFTASGAERWCHIAD